MWGGGGGEARREDIPQINCVRRILVQILQEDKKRFQVSLLVILKIIFLFFFFFSLDRNAANVGRHNVIFAHV